MYYLKKKMEIAGAHFLNLDYNSVCTNLHGHNWSITVYCKAETLDINGMVIDFKEIKELLMILDHANFNDIFNEFNPTAENIAKWICDNIAFCYKVKVRETKNNTIIYVKPE